MPRPALRKVVQFYAARWTNFPPPLTIVMTVEHRAAPGLNDIDVELADHGQGPAMRLRRAGPAEAAPEPETPEQRIVQTLADAETPLSQRQIRERAATWPTTIDAAL